MDNDEIKDLLYSANNGFSVENHNQAVVEAFRRGKIACDAEIEKIKRKWEFTLDKYAEANAKRNALMAENQRLKEELARMRQMRDDVLKEAKTAEAIIQQGKE
jgi:FtsZ-binding cell division protein ZapB